jgi:hypothetical protein
LEFTAVTLFLVRLSAGVCAPAFFSSNAISFSFSFSFSFSLSFSLPFSFSLARDFSEGSIWTLLALFR